MKNLVQYSLLFLLLEVFAAFGAAQSPPPPLPPPPFVPEYNLQTWKVFTSPTGRFSIRFPNKPIEPTTPAQLPLRPETHVFASQTGAGAYFVAYSDLTDGAKDTPEELKTVYDGGRDTALQSYAGTLLNETETGVQGYRGREVTLETKPNGVRFGVIRLRMFLVGRRLYQVIALTRYQENFSIPKAYTTAAETFLVSFQLAENKPGVSMSPPVVPPSALERAAGPPAPVAVTVPQAALGTFADSVYTNTYFGFRLSVPKEWYVADRSVLDRTKEATRESITHPNPGRQAALEPPSTEQPTC